MFGVAGLRMQALVRGEPLSPRHCFAYTFWSALGVAGHISGGALMGTGLGWLGSILPPLAVQIGWGLLALFSLAWAAAELGLLYLPMPQLHRQVPRGWMGRLPWNTVALGYGLQLGCGVATRITVTTTYAVLGVALLSRSPAIAAAVVGTFGFARAVLPLCVYRPLSSPQESFRRTEVFTKYEQQMRRVNSFALLAAAPMFVYSALSTASNP